MTSSASKGSSVVAELGPTNTGKTHRAIEQMLEHDTGMIGLPLRLLAREVYDRVTARVGEGRVALMTGEEKRIPPGPDYWVCTVEAMPTARTVDFVAVDEIQLCAHRERGHVFTDRLLHARGARETWFLGAETMRPMVQSLIPTASFKRATRLSQLRWGGSRSLKSLPPRSAVVAFSVEQVYELAESLRRLHGGVAVVLGALSPRTRNAQVAMYQSGEVQYLVATDAIGMGLNLDLSHVAFAGTSKYDGYEQRDLFPDELAQIAGRAGRHLNDGTFGTLNQTRELPPNVITAIEAHRFPAVRSIVWRNGELDFSSPEALLDALTRPPSNPAFSRVDRADDFDALKELVGVPEIRAIASRGAALELLWEVCQVPDFRKRALGQHVALLRETYLQLTAGAGHLEEAWLEKQVSPLEDASGDIHTLMDRLSAIRVWTYISHRAKWLREPAQWQVRTRRIEDALGDALHERLVERFVEKAARRTGRRFVKSGGLPPPAAAADNPFAALRSLSRELQDAPAEEMTEEQFVEQVIQAPHAAFEVEASGRISFDGEPIARLVRGIDRRTPQIALTEPDAWTGGARRRLERRLIALARDLVTEAMGGFPADAFTGKGRSAPARGLAFRLGEGLGIIRQSEAAEQWALLDEETRHRFEAQGVRQGLRFFFVADALSMKALTLRSALTSLFEQRANPSGAPREPVVDRAAFGGADPQAYGYEAFGPTALRVDVVERLVQALRDPRARSQAQALMRELGLEGGLRARIVRELGGQEPGSTRTHSRKRRRRGRGGGKPRAPAPAKKDVRSS